MNPRPPAPGHPGQLLRQRMRRLRLSANKLAGAIRVPTNRVTLILNGKRGITVDTAVRLGRFFDIDPHQLLAEQARYDVHATSRTLKTRLATMKTAADLPPPAKKEEHPDEPTGDGALAAHDR